MIQHLRQQAVAERGSGLARSSASRMVRLPGHRAQRLGADRLGAERVVLALHQPAAEGGRFDDAAAEVGVDARHQHQLGMLLLERELGGKLDAGVEQVVRDGERRPCGRGTGS